MKTLFLNSLIFIALFAMPAMASAQNVKGVWRTETTEEGYLEIEVSQCAAALCGRIVGARDPQGQSGPYEHLNKLMIWDMKPDNAAGSWSGGKIWDPRSNRKFNSRMSLENGQLKVAGCVLGICQSQTWKRVR